MPPEYAEYIRTQAQPRFQAMAKQQYGIEINSGKFGIESRAALIGAQFAAEQGKAQTYHDAVFRAYWQQAQSIDDVTVLTGLAQQVGLDPVLFRAALEDVHYEEQVEGDIAQAQTLGLNGVPALVFDSRYLVSGAQPYSVLSRVVEDIQSRKGSA